MAALKSRDEFYILVYGAKLKPFLALVPWPHTEIQQQPIVCEQLGTKKRH
jgi:hypothetical protein